MIEGRKYTLVPGDLLLPTVESMMHYKFILITKVNKNRIDYMYLYRGRLMCSEFGNYSDSGFWSSHWTLISGLPTERMKQ